VKLCNCLEDWSKINLFSSYKSLFLTKKKLLVIFRNLQTQNWERTGHSWSFQKFTWSVFDFKFKEQETYFQISLPLVLATGFQETKVIIISRLANIET
jgi:hypothetical protein